MANNIDGFQKLTVSKSIVADGCNGFRDNYRADVRAPRKTLFLNSGERLTVEFLGQEKVEQLISGELYGSVFVKRTRILQGDVN